MWDENHCNTLIPHCYYEDDCFGQWGVSVPILCGTRVHRINFSLFFLHSTQALTSTTRLKCWQQAKLNITRSTFTMRHSTEAMGISSLMVLFPSHDLPWSFPAQQQSNIFQSNRENSLGCWDLRKAGELFLSHQRCRETEERDINSNSSLNLQHPWVSSRPVADHRNNHRVCPDVAVHSIGVTSCPGFPENT